MENNEFLTSLSHGQIDNPDGNVLSGIWNEYEKVVLHSLVTSFGLDFVVRDQRGGDVDTLRSVRDTSISIEERYKNPAHRDAFDSHGPYISTDYHAKDMRYRGMTQMARAKFNDTGEFVEDAYVPDNMLAPSSAAFLRDTGRRLSLDHVVSAHEIHDDPGRILAGLDGTDLANSPDNLRFTNMKLNCSKNDLSIDEFLDARGADLPEATQQRMREVDESSRSAYEQKIEKAYYFSEGFFVDAASAAASRGLEMGLRQALGFVFVEIWFSCKVEVLGVPDNSEISDYLSAILRGVESGVVAVKDKYKGLLEGFESGFVAGALASLTTTLCNIFISTEKSTVRNIRQAYASVVQAGNVLLFNPNDLLLGDRLQTATVILATGANVIIGSTVGDMMRKTPLGLDHVVGPSVINFASVLVSGLLSCTLLLFLDRSRLITAVLIWMM